MTSDREFHLDESEGLPRLTAQFDSSPNFRRFRRTSGLPAEHGEVPQRCLDPREIGTEKNQWPSCDSTGMVLVSQCLQQTFKERRAAGSEGAFPGNGRRD